MKKTKKQNLDLGGYPNLASKITNELFSRALQRMERKVTLEKNKSIHIEIDSNGKFKTSKK